MINHDLVHGVVELPFGVLVILVELVHIFFHLHKSRSPYSSSDSDSESDRHRKVIFLQQLILSKILLSSC